MFTVTFYSRNTGKKLALNVRKFEKEQDAKEYAHWVVLGKPESRFAKITNPKWKDKYLSVYEYGGDGNESPYYYRTTKKGSLIRMVNAPRPVVEQRYTRPEKMKDNPYWNEMRYDTHFTPYQHGPLTPLYPTNIKTKKRR